MGTVSRVHTFSSGAILTAAQLNNEFDNLLTSSAINGGLDATNLGVTAGQATASKALVVDSSRNLADGTAGNRINNLALSGTFESTGLITATAGITSGSNIVSDTDSTDDLGTTGVRWRNLYVDDVTVTNNVSIGGTLTLTGGLTLNGNVAIGDSASDTLTVNSTITSNLIFTDNTYDIGASGATRPRDLHLSRNALMGGTLGVTGLLTATAGVTSGSNIVSDTDSTDDLGTTSVRWANLYVDSIGDTGQALAITAGSNNVNVTAGTLALTGAQTISSTLGVTGLITASGGVSGTTGTFSGDVAVDTDTLFVDVSEGRVGVNAGTTPGAALDVAHTGTSAAFRVYNSQATDPYGILIDNTGANLSDSNYVADFRVGGYSILKLNNSGQMAFAPNSYGGASAGNLTIKKGSINDHSIRLEAGGTTSTYLEYRGYLGHSWYVDSTRKATLDATGLGIGDDSPSALIHASQGGEPPAEGMLILEANSSSRQLRIQPPTNADNGFFDARGGNMTFLDDGTEIFRYNASTISTSSGINVGIGTASPSGYFADKLVVSAGNADGITIAASATSDINYFLFADGTSGNAAYRGQILYDHGNDKMQLATAATAALTIDSSQQIGVGTASPQVDFHVDNASTNGVARISTSHSSSYAQLQLVNQSGNYWYQTLVQSDNSYRLYNGSDRLTVSSAGRVGINATDTLNAMLYVEQDSASTAGGIQIGRESGSASWAISNVGSNLRIGSDTNGNGTVDLDAITVDYQGLVGVGTSSPTEKMDVTGAVKASAAANNWGYSASFFDRSGNDTRVVAGATSGNSSNIAFWTYNSGTQTEKARILSSGGITFNGDTAAANALDDYEEGTFSPALGSGSASYSEQLGAYTKIGNVVFINVSLTWTGGPTSGNLVIGSLPFTSSSTLQSFSPLGQVATNSLTVSGYEIAGYISANSTLINFTNQISGSGSTNKTYEAAGTIRITGHYFV
tara:strand:+ start:1345 stop:4257 length:2913 start_codon:yes stop_codon:yes gene_type:complete